MEFMSENRRITRSISNELRRAGHAQISFGQSDSHYGSVNYGNSDVSSVYTGYIQNDGHVSTGVSKDRDTGTPNTTTGVCRNTSEEIFLQNIMDASMAVPSTPSIDGFMGSPALNRISSEDLFQNMLANTADQAIGFGQSPAGYRPRQNSRRMASELAALLAQQNGALFPRIDSSELTLLNQTVFNEETLSGDTVQQKASNRNSSADRPPANSSPLKNIPWFQHPSPIMTRSRSSEMRRMASEMQGLPFPPTAESLQRLATHATNDQLNQHHGGSGSAWSTRNSNLHHGKPPAPPHYHSQANTGSNQNHALPPLPQFLHHSLPSGQYNTSHLHQHHLLQSQQIQQPEITSTISTALGPQQNGPSTQSALYHQSPTLNPRSSSPLSSSSGFDTSGFGQVGNTVGETGSNASGFGQVGNAVGETSLSAVVGLLKGSIERKKQEASLRAVDRSKRNADSKPVVGANHTDMIHLNPDLVSQTLPGQPIKMNSELQVRVGGDGGAISLDVPEDYFSPSRQFQVKVHSPANDVGQTMPSCAAACDIASHPLQSPCRSFGEEKNGIWTSPPTQHAPSPSGSSGCGTGISADGPCNSSQTVSTLNQGNTGFQNQSLKRVAVGSVDQPAKRPTQSNGNHASPSSGPNTSEAGPYDSPRNQDLDTKQPNSQLQRAGSITSSGRSGHQGDQIDDTTKKRRVERQRKMAEAKGRCYIPADLQAASKRLEALEKEVRSLKLNLAFMNRKDSEQTKQIEELEKQNKDLRKQLLEELESKISGRN